ncbi:MAG: ABC transporter ATP-binding protein [Candidatus Bipolaricaulis sp.]|jgi:simple sugar transport system ATP-binding protein|uniref:Monosaccharide-transporting ATPase n=1 Tax=Candidatus Bipolaricaulis anaerobius TaxID=2026885 RepID=A0A2X3KI83_9BACT|nr:ABC transporter ATP-binding protein [Candidatus Bipolaricaulis anaerobius]MBP7726579.1 ABC transporter ATP-binding protein [Candidatus Bipolaricaulis sp.]MDD2911924.1 ABC transporter ATP-binding protein [Candidatus Bipolaricaulis anaerobius]SQD92072.1 Monosaccharide-transporting ATPase [Candidatus Bipolaricaulis anaerobius]HOD73115.1 ABC transporter ATP-binding protein [Candidatus Bipolaricaulis anaerobius]HQM38044.1 ABC transporter ATP-binding protein [Candidatus Bipolaricaulis anaerobius]
MSESSSRSAIAENGYFLRAERITKIYSDGTVALREATVELRPSEILGLLGENGAGKTTLTKILSGLLPPTKGRVVSPRGPVRFSSPREALEFGIGMVHQHFALVGTFTAVENVALSQERPFAPLQLAQTRAKLETLMEESGLRVPLDVPVEKLAVGEQQRVEILKVLSRDVGLLILDEPTSVLTPLEVDELFRFLRRLRDEGKAIVLITHKLKEVGLITDRVVVLRKGEVVGDVRTSAVTAEELAQLMVGKALETRAGRAVELSTDEIPAHARQRGEGKQGPGVLHVEGLSVAGDTKPVAVHDLTFDVYGGEIFGIAGVEGNGQTELVEALTGLRPALKGIATINGRNILGLDPRQIYELGVAHIPEDRWVLGLVLPFTLAENAILGVHRWDEFRGPLSILRWRKINAHVRSLMERFEIQATGPSAPAKSLSGGNQQKLIVGRELAKDPAIVIASQPTRGLDVGAAQYIRDILVEMRDRGRAILLVSADLDEVLALSDRVAVMYEGKFMAVARPEELDREKVGLLMGGVGVGGKA